MKQFTIVTFLALTLTLARQQFDNLVLNEVRRTVDIKGRNVDCSVEITALNIGNTPIKHFYYMQISLHIYPIAEQSQIVTVLLVTGNGEVLGKNVDDLALKSDQQTNLIDFELEEAIQPKKSQSIRLKILYFKRWVLYPKAITLQENQLVLFEDNKYLYSPYVVKNQNTVYKTNMIKSITEDSTVVKGQQTVTYGGFVDIPPFSREYIKIHQQNNNPFPISSHTEKKIEVSHWGNIHIQTFNKIYNSGADLAGEFGRVVFNQWNKDAGKNALKEFYAELPLKAWGAYYYDEIGNISTSNAYRDNNKKKVRMTLQPRFGILGGWKFNFYLGYNLSPQQYLKVDQANNQYILKQQFYIDIHDLICEEYTLKVVLPEGAHDISVKLPFEVKSQREELTFSYLDTIGRPTVVIQKDIVSQYHNQFFEIHYKLDSKDMIRKPILLFIVFLSFFSLLILINRADLKTFKTE